MTQTASPGMPLSKEELIKLKHQINSYDYRVIEHGSRRFLIIRSALEFPDIVNDLEIMINKFDIRDITQIDFAMIIGDAEVIGVSVDAISSLLNRRIEDDEMIAADLDDKIEEPYSTITFESEDDPLKAVRLGIRVPGKLENYKPNELKETLFSKMKSFPKDCEIVYLISDDGYIRISGKVFYKQLSEFLRDNPEKNLDLSEDIADTARGNMAEYFVGKDEPKPQHESSKQEQLGKYLNQTTEPKQKDIDDAQNISEPSQVTEIEQSNMIADSTTKFEPIIEPEKPSKPHDDLKPKISPLTDDDLKGLKNINIDVKKSETGVIDKISETEFKHEIRFETSTSSELPTNWPDLDEFVTKLRLKLSRAGIEIIPGVELPGIDIIGQSPNLKVNKIFISYMPKFNFKKAIAIDRSLSRFPNELCILVGPKSDYDLKLFIIGKNILLTDLETILNTSFLDRLEENL